MKLKYILSIFLLIIFLITFTYLLVSPMNPSDIPEGVWEDYNSMGINALDFITPLIVKIFIIMICLTLLILCIVNRSRFLKSLKKVTTEKWFVFFSFLFWYIFNDAINFQGGSPRGIYEIGIFFGSSGTPVIEFILIGFVGSLFLMMILFLRKFWDFHGKKHKLDAIGIVLGFLGFALMGLAVFHQLNGVCGSCEIIFGISRGTVYHIGVLSYLSSLVYYLFTE